MSNQSFAEWLKRHGCDRDTLWNLQNMLGSCLGWDHPLHLEAKEAWIKGIARFEASWTDKDTWEEELEGREPKKKPSEWIEERALRLMEEMAGADHNGVLDKDYDHFRIHAIEDFLEQI